MLDPDEPWPAGHRDVDVPEPWPPTEYPPEWPAGADPEYVRLEATWGDEYCQWLIQRCREQMAGIAADGEHRDLAGYATDGGEP